MSGAVEEARLTRLYEDLRRRLLDVTKRNQLLNYNLNARSKRSLRIVDGSLDVVHRRLAGDEVILQVAALPEPGDIPSEERNEEFRSALDRARAINIDYLTAIENIESTGRDDEVAMEKLERQLRDSVREELGLGPRPSRRELNRGDHALSLGIDPSFDLGSSQDAERGRVLQTLKFPDELEAILEKISGDAQLAEQEMGLSTLFLAFGFLEWYESDNSEKKAYAPLLLLPVQIDKKKLHGRWVYSLALSEGSAETNLSLQKLLEKDFSRNLPDFEVSDGNTPGSIETYIGQVEKAVDGLKRWNVRRWLVLGHFSFGRFAMYSDLEAAKWGSLSDNVLVGALLRGTEQRDGEGALPSMPDDYMIDDPEIEVIAPLLIQDADASQHSALIDAMKGANLVIQGPPGTGKSQTITNIIANALAVGKRVLFLAEKQAALDVVKRRLDRAGLGDFCLELHSDKISPKIVIASLKNRYELGTGRELASAMQQIDHAWRQNRHVITSYVQALHANISDGTTAFDLIWQSLRGHTRYAGLVDAVKDITFPFDLLENPARLSEVAGDLEIFAGSARRFADSFGHPSGSPWSRVKFGDIATYDAPRFVEALLVVRRSTLDTMDAITRHAHLSVTGVDDFEILADLDSRLGEAPEVEILVAIDDLDLQDLERALAVKSELLRAENDLLAISDLRHENPEHLAIAAALMRLTPAAEFADQSPALAYRLADGEVTILKKLVNTIETMISARDLLGLSSSTPASQLPAVAVAVCFLGIVPKHCRRWIVELPHASEAAVARVIDRWRSLVHAESTLVPVGSYQHHTRPSPSDVDAAALTLRKNGLGLILAMLNGSVNAAHELCRRLGIDVSSPAKYRTRAALDTFSAHLRAVQTFEADKDLGLLFGSFWRGLHTPMQEVHDGIKQRALLKESLLALPGGEETVEWVMALSADAINSLSSASGACEGLLALAPDVIARLDGTPVDRFVSYASRRIAALNSFLLVDPNHLLADFEAPIRHIAHAHSLLGRVGRIRSTLANHTTADHAGRLGSSDDRIAATARAIAWKRSILASSIKAAMKTLLLSHSAGEARESIRLGAREWVKISKGAEAAGRGMLEFDAGAITTMPPSELLALIDDLSTHSQELGEFVALRQQRRRLDAAGVAEFLLACDLHVVAPECIPGLFATVVAARRAALVRRTPALADNNGTLLEVRRRSFVDRDLAKIKTDRVTIHARLLKGTPPVGSQSGSRKTWTEMRLLTNEFSKAQRFTPVRQILARAGSAAQVLKPCFMMSPLLSG